MRGFNGMTIAQVCLLGFNGNKDEACGLQWRTELKPHEDHKPEFYENIFKKIAQAAKVEIVNISKYVFTPQGVTLLCLLKESHMSFHTFPEKGIVSFDFFTCGSVSPNVSLEILKKELPHSTVIKKDFDRDSVSSIMPLPENEDEWSSLNIVFITKLGKIRKNNLEDFRNIQANER